MSQESREVPRASGSGPKKRDGVPGGLPGGLRPRSGGGARDFRKRYTAAQKRELVAAYEASGQSLREFCASHEPSVETLRRWVRLGVKDSDARRTKRSRRYTPEQRRAAVEAFVRSGRTRTDFAALWGISIDTLSSWIRRYESEGPKGLETRKGRQGGAPRRIPESVRAEVERTKRRFPEFGLRRVRDFLARFHGVRVSQGTVKKTLDEAGLSDPPPKKRPRRKRMPPRRFERARPGELWQTDITSFVLPRPGRRVYLVVFLDDHSRYVVSWGLHTHQRNNVVIEALLDGIARFGKPVELLSDQGPQYFSWRGKSAFTKLLEKEGIRHVVARSHHPQTVGKCERLWKTIGEEFWSRVRPDDLTDARDRLSHWIANYNHFRPHQGIDGLVPADRFFGAEDATRKSVEERLSKDELDLALSEAPRRSVYLFGQIGDRQVSMHGERGRLVVHTPEGDVEEMDLDALGTNTERNDERGDDPEADAQEDPETQADALPDPGPTAAAGAGPVGTGERGGAEEGARDGDGDPGVLAGPCPQGGGGRAARGASAAGVAALAASGERDAGGPPAPAAQSWGAGLEPDDPAPGRPQAPSPADRRAGGEAEGDRGAGAGAEGAALEPGSGGVREAEGGARWPRDEEARQEAGDEAATSESRWGDGLWE